MKKIVLFILLLIFLLLIFLLAKNNFRNTIETRRKSDQNAGTVQSQKLSMKIISSAFNNNENLPKDYTCDGKNVNPPLAFSEVPPNIKSLALIVDDPDAPSKTWVHWLVYNIDPGTTEVASGSVPQKASLGVNDFGEHKYGGPCPPSGTHRYFFKLYALDTVLTLPSQADKKAVEEAMNGHVLDQAELVGLYGRK